MNPRPSLPGWWPTTAVLAIFLLGSGCDPAPTERSGEAVAAGGDQVTVSLQPDEKLAETLSRVAESGPEGPGLRLNLRGVAAPASGEVAVRVFFNLADNAQPSPEDPGYVGEFAFFPTGAGAPPQSFVLDPAKAVRNLRRVGRFNPSDPIKVTLVAVATGSGEAPAEFKIKFDEITVSEARP